MKKLLSYLFLLVAVIVLASCEAVVSVSSLQVSGQKEEFVLGEEFSTGEMTVIAVYTNGNEEDVTSKVKVTPSTDMSAAGNFTVEVYFEGCTAEYNIRIEQPQLVSLDVKHELANKAYLVGQELSTEGVEVVAHYTNSITGETQESVEAYEVVVKNAAGEVVEGAFEAVGTYSVEISFGGKTESYEVEVSNNFASVEAAIEAGVANAGKVASGSYSKTTYAENWDTGEFEPSLETYGYEFGKNSLSYDGDYGYKYYFSALEDGSIFGVQESYSINAIDTYGEELNGVALSVLYYSYECYGLEALVVGLYEQAVEAGAAVEESVEAGVYSFAYNNVIENYGSYYYVVVEVSFTLGQGAEIASASYSETIYYSYEVEVAEDGSWVVAEGVTKYPTEYEFTQVAGERVAENPYSPEKVLYTSFDFVDEEGNVYEEGTYETVTGNDKQIKIMIGNAAPETAVASLNNVEVVVTDENGEVSYDFSANYYNGQLYMYGKVAGTYTVTVTCGSIVKEYVYNVEFAVPSTVAVSFYGPDAYGYKGFNEASSAVVYLGSKAYVKASFPEYTNDAHTIELKEASEKASLTYFEASYYEEPYENCYVFDATEVGTYTIVVTSTAVEGLVAELSIEVEEAPDVSALLVGKYSADYYGTSYVVEFFPEASEVSISGQYGSAVYTYAVEGATLVTTQISGDYMPVSLVLDSNFNLALSYYGSNIPLNPYSVYTELSSKTYVTTISGVEFVLMFYSDGSGQVYGRASMFFNSTAEENEDGSYTITLVEEGIFVNNQIVVSADLSTVSGKMYDAEGAEVEVTFEIPLATLVYDTRWADYDYLFTIQFYSDGTAYLYYNDVSYYSVGFSVSEDLEGNFVVTFDFESYGYESCVKDNTAIITYELSYMVVETTSGETFYIYQM